MYHEKMNRKYLALGLVLFVCGMAAGAMWDLAIDRALYNAHQPVAIAMECFGYYPLYLPVLAWCAYVVRNAGRKVWQRVLCGVLAVGGAGALCYVSADGLAARGVAGGLAWALGAWAVLAALLCVLLRSRIDAARLELAFFWASVYMVLNNVVVNLLKLLWNRTRFDDMLAAGSFADFTSWLHPLGNGGSSFPSGHTAAACGIFVLVLLCDVFPAWAKRRTLVWACCWAYIAGMALCRMVIGRHYLSDTLMAAFVMTALLFAMVRSKPYRASLARLGGTSA